MRLCRETARRRRHLDRLGTPAALIVSASTGLQHARRTSARAPTPCVRLQDFVTVSITKTSYLPPALSVMSSGVRFSVLYFVRRCS
ncbi:hypothetical protein PILCRDRAFT_810224 [Piloderma croceum F 1598]|uniref:Uncharacterized protein n=1 Tax=Piloderma croceum (strain F 1598) TaxID=765440 RepID=A0A0C3GNU8_PILCF|nr:hypothetical protein PILCRDRAFT_810224 [Piloderma croceum F 1598]